MLARAGHEGPQSFYEQLINASILLFSFEGRKHTQINVAVMWKGCSVGGARSKVAVKRLSVEILEGGQGRSVKRATDGAEISLLVTRFRIEPVPLSRQIGEEERRGAIHELFPRERDVAKCLWEGITRYFLSFLFPFIFFFLL